MTKKKALKIALVALVVAGVCGVLSTCAAWLFTPTPVTVIDVTETPTEAAVVVPTEVLPTSTPNPTSTPSPLPTPTVIVEDTSTQADLLYLLGTDPCVGEGVVLPALGVLQAAFESEDVASICTTASRYKAAIVEDQACWDRLVLPEEANLQESHQLYDQALGKFDLAADYILNFCVTKELGYLELAGEEMVEGASLAGKSKEAIERFIEQH